jgi:hypothetical protein
MEKEEAALVRQPVSKRLEFGPGEAESLGIFFGTQTVPTPEIASPPTRSGGEKKSEKLEKYVDYSRENKPAVRAGLRALADFCRGCHFGQPLARYEKGLVAALENKAGREGSVKQFSASLFKVGSAGDSPDLAVARIRFYSNGYPEVWCRNSEGKFIFDLALTARLRSMLQEAGVIAEVQVQATEVQADAR